MFCGRSPAWCGCSSVRSWGRSACQWGYDEDVFVDVEGDAFDVLLVALHRDDVGCVVDGL